MFIQLMQQFRICAENPYLKLLWGSITSYLGMR